MNSVLRYLAVMYKVIHWNKCLLLHFLRDYQLEPGISVDEEASFLFEPELNQTFFAASVHPAPLITVEIAHEYLLHIPYVCSK